LRDQPARALPDRSRRGRRGRRAHPGWRARLRDPRDRLRRVRRGIAQRIVSPRAIFERHLFPPLRFACRNGGERAATLRDLARLGGVAAEKAAAAGVDEKELRALLEEARAFDEASGPKKAEELRALLARLDALVGLPP